MDLTANAPKRQPEPRPMAAVLYYWKDYQENTEGGLDQPVRSPPEKLYQRAPRFRALSRGDRVWLIARATVPTRYVLLGRLVVAGAGTEASAAARQKYGPHFITPDLTQSHMIQGLDLPNVEPAIRTRLSVMADAAQLGHAFQGFAAVRPLTEEDEEVLSALMSSGSAESSFRSGEAQDRDEAGPEIREYLIEQRVRDRALPERLKRLYDGKCQVCGTKPLGEASLDIVEAHHLTWLSEGGPDSSSNIVLLCPNHHRAVHAARAELRSNRGKLLLAGARASFPILLNHHLKPVGRGKGNGPR